MSSSRVSRVTKPLPSPDVRLEIEHNEVIQGTDFVCISAFSEVEGPNVIRLLPLEQRGFDCKSYALKIMSVDLHNQEATSLFVEDSQSVIQEGSLHCYVHHSYLLDLRARGYCRPLCFSYITQDSEKIMACFDSLMDEFTHVSNILKYGNHLKFMEELESELDIIEQHFLSRESNNHTDSEADSNSVVEDDFVSARGTDGSTESFYDAESGIESDSATLLSATDTEHNSENLDHGENEEQNGEAKGRPIRKTRSTELIQSPRYQTNAIFRSKQIEGEEKQNEEHRGIRIEPSSDSDLASSVPDHESLASSTDSSHLEQVYAKKGDSETSTTKSQQLSPQQESLESVDTTHVEEKLWNNTEREEINESLGGESGKKTSAPDLSDNPPMEPPKNTTNTSALYPDHLLDRPSTLIKKSRVNRSVSLPIREVTIVHEKMKETKGNDVTAVEALQRLRENIKQAKGFYSRGEVGTNRAIGNLVASLSQSKTLKQELHLTLLKKRASTKAELRDFDEICGLEAHSFAMKRIETIRDHFAREMAVLNLEREDCFASVPLSTLMTMGNCPVLNFNWENDSSPHNFLQFPNIQLPPSLLNKEEAPTFHMFQTGSSSEYESFSEDESFITPDSQPSSPYMEQNSGGSKVFVHRSSHLLDNAESHSLYDPLFPLHLPTATEFGVVKLESYAAGLWSQSTNLPGQGLYQIRSIFDFFPRLVYSLLVGRVLIVHASVVNKVELSRLLRALKIFIPGCWRSELVTYWQETPLRITDLSKSKLIGLSKEATPTISGGIKKFVSVLNFDDKTLYAPSFDCSYVESILLPPKRHFPDESSYLAYIHTELFSLTCKASLYYQMCCLGITKAEGSKESASLRFMSNSEILKQYATNRKKNGTQADLFSGLPATLREESKHLFQQVLESVDHSNLPIIEYLAEIIKEQQAMELGQVDCKHPILKLIEIPFVEFSHRKKKL